MDLRGICNGVTGTVNPNVEVTVQRSTGFTIGTGHKQVPSYAAGVTGPAQVQSLDFLDLKQLEGLNIQGEIGAIYLRGVLAGVIRPDQTGGDIIQIGTETWLVTKVLEAWPGWTKAAIVRQMA